MVGNLLRRAPLTTPMARPWDLIVIGGGSAGLTAATVAARVGARVLLVDKTRLGGDCLHDGCVPSKALLASARLAHRMRRAPEFGIAPVGVQVDLAAVMARIRAVQAEIAKHDSPEAMGALGVEVAFGGARFLDARTVRIGKDRTEVGDRFVIATGSSAVAPRVPGLSEVGFLNHANVFGLERLPARLAVMGGGPIGVEIGQAFARFGSAVTILERAARLLEREEPDVSRHLADVLAREGIDVRLSCRVASVRRDGERKVVVLEGGGEIVADAIFVAVGRRPTLDGLGLAAARIATSERGIVVDDALRTSQPHIFAVGDCAGGPQFTHWAEYEARVATRNALFRGTERRSMRIVPWVTFTDPEVARVGMTEEEAHAHAHQERVHVHRFPFARVDRALTEGEGSGFAKVVVDARERILGAHLIGPGAGEALVEWTLAMQNDLKLSDVGRAIHVYPTLARINRRVADDVFLAHGLPSWVLRLGARFSPAPSEASAPPSPKKRWATWVLGALYVAQGLGKALAPSGYVVALDAFDLFPRAALWPVVVTWTAIELLAGAGLLYAGLARRVSRGAVYAAAAALVVGVAYAVMTTRATLLHIHVGNCTCFGKFMAQPLSPFVLAQDALMLVYTAWQLAKVRGWARSGGRRLVVPDQTRSAINAP